MSEKKFEIDKSKLWHYNDALYTDEFVAQLNEERKKAYQEMLDERAKKQAEKEKQNQIRAAAIQKEREAAWARGEIHDVFIKQYLEAKITVANWALGLGIVTTVLFKDQWAFWIICIILYILYVKKAKADAIEADKNIKDFGKKK